jgi:hypothetical protein
MRKQILRFNGTIHQNGRCIMIKNLSNTQKKILAGIIAITFPIWILALPFVVLFGMIAILYTEIAYALGVEEDEKI